MGASRPGGGENAIVLSFAGSKLGNTMTTDSDAALAANLEFYRAFATRDVAAMDALWARQAPVACLHPGWTALKDRDTIMQSWEGILSNLNAPRIACFDVATVAGNRQGAGAEAAQHLSGLLLQLAKADPPVRKEAEAAVVEPLRMSLDQLRDELKPQRITTETIPADLKRAWVTPDGRARVEVLPNGDPDDTVVLRNFVTAVLAIEPNATGPAVLLFEAGNTVVRAFIEAGIFALAAIALLLWITLRRLADVLLTLVPLLVAGIVTLELCAVLDLPLNFANIIALPLLLGVGVAFKIYYIMAWRSGKRRWCNRPLLEP
jgi:hypothetical protein